MYAKVDEIAGKVATEGLSGFRSPSGGVKRSWRIGQSFFEAILYQQILNLPPELVEIYAGEQQGSSMKIKLLVSELNFIPNECLRLNE